MKQSIFTLLFSVLLSGFSIAQTGTISGKVVDMKTGETLIGSTVVVDNDVNLAAATDLDGNFTIARVPVGKHKVKVTYIGYQELIQDVEVKAGSVTMVNLTMSEDAVNLKEAVVTANIVKRDNESAIFIMQKNSSVMQSGISGEEMKRSPDKNSGEVIRRVSGATIQDGKFAIIRGLSDRYNMAMLNNTILPSTEPDRKAFAFDVFPSNVLDNIIIMKTGQPNLPSEWAGGLIQLNTRDIPEKNFFNVTYGIGFNEGTTFKNFKTYEGSKTDFLGFDNNVRPLGNSFPGIVELSNLRINGQRDSLRALGRKITNTQWGTENRRAMPNQSVQMSGGFAVRKKDVQIGGVLAMTYSNSLRYSDGTRTRYDAADKALYYDYEDQQYNNSVTAAALANLGVVIKNRHKLTWKNIYTVNSDNTTIMRDGVSYFSATEQRRTSLEFISSRVLSSNLSGEHVFGKQEIKWRWNGGITTVNRDQPKTIRYSYERLYTSRAQGEPNQNTDPFFFQFSYGGSDPKQGAMFYSTLNERMYNAGTDVTIPFNVKNNKQNVTVGYTYQQRVRSFEARNLFIDYPGGYNDPIIYDPNVNNIINQANFDSGKLTMNPFVFPQDMYSATATTHAAYVMMENNIGSRFKAVWGFRFETFRQGLTTPRRLGIELVDQGDEPPLIRTKVEDTTFVMNYFSGAYKIDSLGNVKNIFPVLPSLNLIYKINENMNFRASYSQSMSRPELRELAPFIYYDFLRDVNMTGSPRLLQTFIHNVDLRYEWFMGKGQAVNFGLFYKNFTNTIELTSIAAGGVPQFVYSNGRTANLFGAEVEVRKNLGFISKGLEDLTFMTNMAYIYSRVNTKNVKNNSAEEPVRPMQGQSPFILNYGLSYLHPKIGTGATLLYNQTGHRLYAVGEVGNPSWYENSRPVLDLQLSQKFWKDRGVIRFTISDLIAQSSFFYQNDKIGNTRQFQKSKDDIVLSHRNFRTYTLQVSFNF